MTTSEKVPRCWYLSPRFLASKVREKGIVYCTHAIWRFVRSRLAPRSPRIIVRAKLQRVPDNIQDSGMKQSDVLYAFYDLMVSPATFDIVIYLPLAELARKEAGCSSLHVVIVPGPSEGFRQYDLEDYGADYDIDTMRWRLRNILVPCCWLIPSCQQVTVCTSPEEAQALVASLVKHIFPKDYTVREPTEKHLVGHVIDATSKEGVVLPSIQATPQARRFVSGWIQSKTKGRKVITITLRECSYEHDRNSNLKAWGAFARSMDTSVYCPVIIRDTESAFKPLPPELDGLTVFPEVSWNIELRVALYELSYLNMTVSGGPCVLCRCNRRANYLIFKVLTPGSRADSAKWWRSQGLEPGSQYKHATPFQRYVWEDDTLEVIQEAFREMCDKIEKASAEKSNVWEKTT